MSNRSTCQIWIDSYCYQGLTRRKVGETCYEPYKNKVEAEKHLRKRGWERSTKNPDDWEARSSYGFEMTAHIREVVCFSRSHLPYNCKKQLQI